MPFLADLRARLTSPVAACVDAAKTAAGRALTRKAALTDVEASQGAPSEELPPPVPLQRALRHAPQDDANPAPAPTHPALTPPELPAPALTPAVVSAEPDPMPDPLEEAYLHLARMNSALASTGDADVAAAGARFHAAVRALLDALSRNPGALGDHRHPLASWVPGLALATERYVALHSRAPDPAHRNDLVSVLDQVGRRIRAHADAAEGGNGEFRAA